MADRIRAAGRGATLQRALGVVMLITAVAVAANLDVRFQTLIADRLPSVIVNPTEALEETSAVKEGLAGLRGESRFDSGDDQATAASDLPVLGTAPEFADTGEWFNSEPLTMAGQKGKVTLVDFWTYTCINCIRTFPELKAWDAKYRDKGLDIIGVHTPEFAFERDAANVQEAITQNEIRYPVVQDNEYGTWNAFGNQFWPAKYLIDAEGNVRYTHFGEGAVEETESAIRSLLEEAGAKDLGEMSGAAPESAALGTQTPETYLGLDRAEGYAPRNAPDPARNSYPAAPETLPDNTFALSGSWELDPESATAGAGAAIDATTISQKVFLVLSPPEEGGWDPRRILLDGEPISAADAGADVQDGVVRVGQPAPLRAGVARRSGEAPPDGRACGGHLGLRLHLRLIPERRLPPILAV